MKNMSFAITTKQFLAHKKDVTRRLGWKTLKLGDHVMGIEKGQGLKKGQKVKRLGEIVILRNEPEELYEIVRRPGRDHVDSRSEMDREGFPGMSSFKFVEMFCKANKCEPTTIINRIVFEYI